MNLSYLHVGLFLRCKVTYYSIIHKRCVKLFERHSILHRQVYESTPFSEQSAEVSPMYNNIMIINGLVATLRLRNENVNEDENYPTLMNHSSVQRHHCIHPSVVTLVAGDAHGAEDAPETVGADLIHQSGVDVVQVFVDVGSTEHLRHFALAR